MDARLPGASSSLAGVCVAFDARSLQLRPCGIRRYLAELLRELARTQKGARLLLLTRAGAESPADVPPGAEVLPVFARTARTWVHAAVPGALERTKARLFHTPVEYGVPWRSPCPVVASVHDLNAWKFREEYAPTPLHAVDLFLRGWLLRHRARLVLTASRVVADEIRSRLGVEPDRIRVTPYGGDHLLRTPPAARIPSGLRRPYALALLRPERCKNPDVVFAAWKSFASHARRPAQLAVVGGAQLRGQTDAAMRRSAESAGADVFFVGRVSDAELRRLYRDATVVIAASAHEGFGLPAAEALADGVPLIAARGGALPELVGDGAAMFDPESPAELATHLVRVFGDPATSRRMRRASQARGKCFTWSRCVRAVAAAYAEALASR